MRGYAAYASRDASERKLFTSSGHPPRHLPCKGPFTNDVRREGEGGGCPNSDAVREVA